MDFVKDTAIQIPERERIVLIKRRCPNCPEAERAINKFNQLVPPGEKIKYVNAESPEFERYYEFFKHICGSKSLPTPTIFFDGHLIQWKYGGCEWVELYYLLRGLGKV